MTFTVAPGRAHEVFDLSPKEYKRFVSLYRAAKSAGDLSFTFMNAEIQVAYAEHVIDFYQ